MPFVVNLYNVKNIPEHSRGSAVSNSSEWVAMCLGDYK